MGEKAVQSLLLVERCSKAIITLKTNGRKATDIEASINQWLLRVPSHPFLSRSLLIAEKTLIGNSMNTHDIDISLRIHRMSITRSYWNILMAY